MSQCVRGCVERGQHTTDCQGRVDDGHGSWTQCQGCMPRQASQGVLCMRCWGRLQQLVYTLPSLADHLEAMSAPGTASSRGGSVTPVSQRSLYPHALVLLDDLHSILAAWCERVAWERELRVPMRGTRWTSPDADGVREPIGPAWPGATGRLVTWISPHIAWCAQQYWAGQMIDELTHATAVALGAFPMEMRERISPVLCPVCGCRSLLVSPPAGAGLPQVVRCRVCGLVLDEESWQATRARALIVARSQMQEEAG